MTIQRIGVESAFKVGVVIYGLMFLIFGAIGLACNLALFVPITTSAVMVNGDMVRGSDFFGGIGALGLGVLCFGYLVGTVASALFGGLSVALLAAFYNLAVRWVGGVELEMAGPGAIPANVILSDMRGGR
jgi:hypothetical protein